MGTLIRFLLGGVIVSAFAALGSVFKPTSFAGLFGAAPSIALATLGLEIAKNGKNYASTECRSMIAGAISLGLYSYLVCQLLVRFRFKPLKATASAMALWFLAAFSLWEVFLHA